MAARKKRTSASSKSSKSSRQGGGKKTTIELLADDDTSLPPRRNCGTMANHMRLLEMYPSFRDSLFKLEEQTAKYRNSGEKITTVPIATIKVIVNVVYQTPAQNISDAQIKTQIAVLNRDFRATNTDKSKTPAAFKGLVSDARVKFVLDRITRTPTSKSSFSDDNGVKKASTGGIAPVDTKKYLNIWVCALSGGLLGYAQFPGGPQSTDGVVIHYKAFGTNGTAEAPYNKGRSATHEVGHYFNLRHIWGDTPDCSGSDLVADTPNAAGPNFGSPKFPHVTCNNGPNGDMFMNYMDYTDDDAMFMFTTQQVARIRATLNGPRRGLW
jgi:hypothetical protein